MSRYSWMIGGAQGLGVDTSATIFGNAVARAGYYLYGNREYYSNIKGRHSYFQVVFSEKPIHSISSTVNVLATFDAETIFQHFTEVTDFIIYDKGVEGTNLDMVRSMEPEIAERIRELLSKNGLGDTVKDVISYLEKKGVKAIPINYLELLKKVADAYK